MLALIRDRSEHRSGERPLRSGSAGSRRFSAYMVTKGLIVRLEAKAGKEAELAAFLEAALPLVLDQPATITWFAVRTDTSSFAIVDAFPDEQGRQAHLNGAVAGPSWPRPTSSSQTLQNPPCRRARRQAALTARRWGSRRCPAAGARPPGLRRHRGHALLEPRRRHKRRSLARGDPGADRLPNRTRARPRRLLPPVRASPIPMADLMPVNAS